MSNDANGPWPKRKYQDTTLPRPGDREISNSSTRPLACKHGHNITCRVFEPRYIRTLPPADPLFVCLEAGIVVDLEAHAASGKLIDGFFDIIDGEIEYGEGCGCVVGLGVHNYVSAARDVQGEHAVRLGNIQPKCLTIERLRFLHVV